MSSRISRRQFLHSSGIATASLVGSSLLVPRAALASPVHLRRDIGTLNPHHPIIAAYKKAILAMKALPDSDPLSWAYQAAIHGTTLPGSQAAWNTCEHGTYFFFSWHRMYLWYFERIIRRLSGAHTWALPFWNYQAAAQRKLPLVFRSPAASTNALFVSNRGPGWNGGASSLFPSAVGTASAFAEIPFVDFSSSLEGTPHAAVHVSISGWMGSVATAAQDPIFWLHHCNIDRLWNLWLAQGGGRTDPLDDNPWKTTPFTFFDENRNEVQLTGCDILRAQQQLDYRYQTEPGQVNLFCRRRITIPRFRREILLRLPPPPPIGPDPNPVRFDVDIREVRTRLKTIAGTRGADLMLDFADIEADRQPDVYYEVYLGLPNDHPSDFKSPHYVGNLALFGAGVRSDHQHREFHPATASFRISRAIQASFRRKAETNTFSVLLVPRTAESDRRPLTPTPNARIRIGSATITVRQETRDNDR